MATERDPDADRSVIPDFDQLLTPPISDEQARVMVSNLREMMRGLFCGICLTEARVDLAKMPAEWQAVTIIDGTALCVQHVLVKARDDAERKIEQLLAARPEHGDETPGEE